MQGRPGQGGEPWEKPSNRQMAHLNGTSQHRAIPQRPPGMARVDHPPTTPRVSRPQRQSQSARSLRRQLLIIGSIFLVCAVLACVFGYIGFNLTKGIGASSGAATTSADFLNALSTHNYAQAYQDLGAVITIQVSQDDFTQQAQNDDRCYGSITSYSEVANSATTQGNSQSYTYNIIRSKSSKAYQLRLTLQQDQNSNSWKITDYGNDLGPGQSAPVCK